MQTNLKKSRLFQKAELHFHLQTGMPTAAAWAGTMARLRLTCSGVLNGSWKTRQGENSPKWNFAL